MSGDFTISVIDDDESFRTALVELLLSLGYEAQSFASAVEFIDRGGEGACDCIITDLSMPGISGLDLIQQLTARGSTVPVIMITGHSEPGLEATASASGAVCLLIKPFKEDTLIVCLERALKI
ncbi:response regulator transcription factor [Bradyrhizobium sp. 6(2017)]|uniref:response regulator transcription factor n=1 Tax=Bradyrhizobium sp. 6(2017) TaxID=1197460 RepID=UPI0013E13863|nr:response regulator [Bradyrhizobium sp. 6(2017)]QIG93443.1 response regulator [Bradyrhizobium sp. 6(2017)]